MNMRNTDLDYVSSRYKNDVLNKAMIDNPNLLMGAVPRNNEKLPENFYEVLKAKLVNLKMTENFFINNLQ